MQLVTIPFSHFCEKARWALDRTGQRYRELKFAPVIHRFAVMPLGSTTAPVLVDAPKIIRGSNEIINFADASLDEARRLYPSDAEERAAVDALVERFDEGVAPDARLWLYSWATQRPARLIDLTSSSLPAAQKPIMRAAAPAIATVLSQYFRLKPDTHERVAEAISLEFEFVSQMLSDGREYLVGDRFTAADLAFAAFAGPAIDVANYGGPNYSPPPMPRDLAAQASTWAATPAGEWVSRLYRDHR
jgi:glutathione S-transferase